MTLFHTIVTHVKPHLDEIATIWLLRKFGETAFPGVSTAKVVYWGRDGAIRSATEYEREGILLLGVGGGRFDEHSVSVEEGRKENECTATLVAKALGLDEDPAFAKILKYVLTEDTKGGGQPFDLAAFVKLLNLQFPDKPERVIEWATTALDAKLREQVEFNSISDQEWSQTATIEEVLGRSRTYKMVTVVSENPLVVKYALSARGGSADIVILRRATGHTQVFTAKRAGVNLRDTAQIIRVMEQQAKRQMVTTQFIELGVEGKVPGAEEWYYHTEGQMLLNGSHTATYVPPTKIALTRIQEAVRVGLNPAAFETNHSTNCTEGKCTSKQRWCEWYAWGLHRCRQVRFVEIQRKKRTEQPATASMAQV